MSIARDAFNKANKKSGNEAMLLYLQSIAASLLELSERQGGNGEGAV